MDKSDADRIDEALKNLPHPGFKWRDRAGGSRVPYWFADPAAVKAGYPLKSSNLSPFQHDARLISQRCERLQSEMNAWRRGGGAGSGHVPAFDGTFKTLIEIYRSDPESPYNADITASTRKSYAVYAARLMQHIGELRIDECDGRDVRRWFNVWAEREDSGNSRSPYLHLPRGRTILAVLCAAVSFGVLCRRAGCAEFQVVLQQMEFPKPRPRTSAPTRKQMQAAATAAAENGARSRALCYAIQFETTLRQTDVRGEWVEMHDPRPSAVTDRGRKWIGPTWADIDENLIFRVTHGKTRNTTQARSLYDLKACPMVMEQLQHIPPEKRRGPLIVNEATGLPYSYSAFRRGWHGDYKAAGIPKSVWNRDTRAGGNTEAQDSGALLEDRKQVIGHTAKSATTGQVYDRGVLEAHRRVMKKRTGQD
jgi:hypothetical protein